MTHRVFFLLSGLILFTLACRNQPTKQAVLPGAVTLIPAAADTAWVETGIDAVPETDAVFLEWIPADDGLAAAYEVWREDFGEDFRLIATLNSSALSYTDMSAACFIRYRYIVLPISDEGEAGAAGDTLQYRLLAKATALSATEHVQPEFSWRDPNQPPEAAYLLRLKENGTERRVWRRLVASSYSGDRESVLFNDDGTAVDAVLQKGIEYLWRVDVIGSEANSGSESPWISLRIQ